MEVLSSGDKIFFETAVTIGNFDGLHKGHLELINKLCESAKKKGLKSVIYILEKKINAKNNRITTKTQKVEILKELGVDYVYFEDFTKEFSNIKADSFISDILKNRLNAKLIVVGSDCKFGYKRQGDIEYLKSLSAKLNYDVEVVKKIKDVSSTAIRNLIQDGEISKVNILLNRKYSLEGVVKEGLKIGRTIGFKTANLDIEFDVVLPKNGVYKTKTKYNNKTYNSITNVGNNPTISNLDYKSVETHIFNFDKEIYGENIEVEFLGKIRDEIKFSSKEELIMQIKKDIRVCDNFGKIV